MKLSALFGLFAAANAQLSLYVYDGTNYSGRSRTITNQGNWNIGFSADSYRFRRLEAVNCCVTFCNGRTNVGYRCQNTDRPDASSSFNRVSIGCNGRRRTCNF